MRKRILLCAGILAAGVVAYLGMQLYVKLRTPVVGLGTTKSFDEFFAQLDTARELMQKEDLDQAEGILLRMLKEFNGNPDVQHYIHEPRFELARIHESRREYTKAEKQYHTIIASAANPDTAARGEMALGMLQAVDGGDLELLRELFGRYRKTPEVSARIATKLAGALIDRKEHAEAAALLTQVLEDSITDDPLLLQRIAEQIGQALAAESEAAGSPGAAGDVYAGHARRFPLIVNLCWEWMKNAGRLYTKAERFTDARNIFNRVIRDYPGEGDAWASQAVDEIRTVDAAEKQARSRLTPEGTADRLKAGEKLTVVRGAITESIAWSPRRGTYVIDGTVEVRRPARLAIEAGTRVEFLANASIVVYGSLEANGTEQAPVTFTSAADIDGAGASFFDWDAIRFVEGAGSTVRRARITHAARGIVCEGSQPRLENVTISDCGFTAIDCRKAAPVIVEPRIVGNDGIGIRIEETAGTITGGVIAHNPRGGLIARKTSRPTIAGTVFDGNGSTIFGGDAIGCFDGSDLAIEKAVISNNVGPGIRMIYSAPSIAGCTFEGNGGFGISCESNSPAKISGCTFSRNDGGVSVRIASAPAISGCTFDGNAKFGVRCETGSDPEISGCVFANLTGPGIIVKDVCRPKIAGNTFPAEGIAIRHEGDYNLLVSDNAWPEGTDAKGLTEKTGRGSVTF
ncbi:MAG TPA: right-handed parallel beta-helix repeat-containing protein [Planctomycetota bacterium]|nr:right-handed parallel beta-helix repeat-containing protein [Planctomycetota bacterium]